MKPKNKNNFLIEVTPEIMDELNRMYMHSDIEPVAELHYSPYWERLTEATQTQEEEKENG